jgi:hypothetical protein
MKITELNLQALELRYEKLRARQPCQEKRLLTSLGESGQQSPIIVIRSLDAGRYLVIDGYKRVRGLKKLKEDTAKSVIWDLPEDQALAAWYRMSRSGSRNAFEEGWLIAELHRTWKWGLGLIAEGLSRSKSWCSKRLALVEELPEWMAGEVAQGAIGAHAAASYLAPLTRVNAQDGRLLMEKIRGLGLNNRQISGICQSYRLSCPEVRSKIVADPVLFLKAEAAARLGPRHPALNDQENRVLKNLDLIGNVSLGLVRLWPQVMSYDTLEAAREKLWAAWTRSRQRFGLLEETAASSKLPRE